MSDWGCCKDAVKSVKAGLDLAMPLDPGFVPRILDGISKGEITVEEIDIAVERVLKYVLNVQKPESTLTREECHDICREIDEEAIVLLKNEDNLLPITKEKYKRIAVVGEFAENPVICGFGSSTVFPDEDQVESPLEFIKDYCGDDIEVVYIPAYPTNEYLKEPQFNALKYMSIFEEVDLVLMFVGHEVSVETEGSDRVTSHLNPLFEFIIKRIYPRNQNIVLVAQSGGAFMHLSWDHKIKSIVQMWLGGEAAGSAIANVLFGKVNPSGKLSESFPLKTRTDIDYPGDGYKVCYDEKWRIGYRYYDLHTNELWFPFGHGLSYTKFNFSDFSITKTENGFSVECKVKNIGDTAGKEVVQVYFSDRIATVSRPLKELVAFKKTKLLEPDEEVTVKFDIANEDLAYYNTMLGKWVVEPGAYDILVGASSQDIRLNGEYIYDSECEYTISYNAEQIMG
jgi:beta-glucosidase